MNSKTEMIIITPSFKKQSHQDQIDILEVAISHLQNMLTKLKTHQK